MKTFIVVACVLGVALAKPAILATSPLLAYRLIPGAPIGLDGRVVDTPEVAYAKAEHAAAHINERLNHAAASSDAVIVEPTLVQAKLAEGAPIGLDGRVVDTPEVAQAKAEHAAAHLNEKLQGKSEYLALPALAPAPLITKALPAAIATPIAAPAVVSPLPVLTKNQPGAPIGLDGRVVDTPEVAYAKAEHAAAHLNANLEKAAEDFKQIAANNYVYLSSPYIQYYY